VIVSNVITATSTTATTAKTITLTTTTATTKVFKQGSWGMGGGKAIDLSVSLGNAFSSKVT